MKYNNPQRAFTWNYMSVHASGKLRFLDREGLLQILDKTTAHFGCGADSAVAFDKMPHE